MSVVVSFEDYVPAARFDSLPWTKVRIEEAAVFAGPYLQIDEITFAVPDADPTHPQSRSFTTALGTDVGYWYRVVFVDAAGSTLEPSYPILNLASASPYATVEELAAILKVKPETRGFELRRVLETAAAEINSEIGRGTASPLTGWEVSIAAEVNIERAVEHWRQMESPFGWIGLGQEAGPARIALDSWNQHANKLAPLKASWGFA